jgi:sirohydrochlorin ferrochelatase
MTAAHTQRALLIVAHGSPRPAANDDIVAVADLVRSRNRYDHVVIGYLDCNEPDIATAIDQCVAAGATAIAAVPYFLHSGKHLLRDVPSILEAATARHPRLTITMGDYLGSLPEIAGVLRARVNAIKSQHD